MQDTFTSLTGLIAPLQDGQGEEAGGQRIEVELGRIRPNPEQPRGSASAGFSASSLRELAENIRQHGILNPLLVKDTGRFYQIVAGERRYRAAQLLGLETVPVRVIEPRDDQDELQIALAENLQRKNLGPLEEAHAYRILIQRFGLSYRDLAKFAGRSLAHVHGRLQLLGYDDVREAVEQKKIGIADATQLARVPDEAQRRELLAAVQDGALRGAALRRQVQVFLGELSPEAAEPRAGAPEPESGAEQGRPLDAALGSVERLPTELSEDEQRTLYTLAARAAERLGLQLAPVPAPPPPRAAAEPEEPRVPRPLSADVRRVINQTKESRARRGYPLVNRIRVYWIAMERRGYEFTPGDWAAEPAGDGKYLVSFSYKLDSDDRVMSWLYGPDGSVEPANEEARQLAE
jgi:ParB family chromosome partitioning protein